MADKNSLPDEQVLRAVIYYDFELGYSKILILENETEEGSEQNEK